MWIVMLLAAVATFVVIGGLLAGAISTVVLVAIILIATLVAVAVVGATRDSGPQRPVKLAHPRSRRDRRPGVRYSADGLARRR